MRAWKREADPRTRVFKYFREHPDKFFTEDHVAAQVGIGKRRARRLVHELAGAGKLETVETVSSARWGRPKLMFRSVRSSWDSIAQAEAFK